MGQENEVYFKSDIRDDNSCYGGGVGTLFGDGVLPDTEDDRRVDDNSDSNKDDGHQGF